jgi:hypothetical protein
MFSNHQNNKANYFLQIRRGMYPLQIPLKAKVMWSQQANQTRDSE